MAMGSAVSHEQIELLRAIRFTNVNLILDGDDAGRKATLRAIPELVQHFYARAPEVPGGFKPHKAEVLILNSVLNI